MIRKDFQPQNKPYIPPRYQDNRPLSTQIIKTDDSLLSAAMISVINSNNPTDILNFFQKNLGSSYKDKEGNTTLHFLILIDNNKLDQKQKVFIIEKLIIYPFSIPIDDSNNQMETPLHIAIIKQYHDIVECLLKNGANPNSVNSKHQNALHLAFIPNIQPCEKNDTPEPIINIENSIDEKNTIYNEVLSVFYNHREKIQPAIEIIKFHASNIDNFYEDFKQSNISIVDDKIQNDDTQIDKSLKDIQNTYNNNLIETTTKPSDIKKNINYQIIKSIQSISAEYNRFIGPSLSEINLENRNFTKLDEPDIEVICKHLLSSKNNIDDIEQQIDDAQINVRNKIYEQIDQILVTLNSNYLWKKNKDFPNSEMPILEHIPQASTIHPIFYNENINETIKRFGKKFDEKKYYYFRNTKEEYETYVITVLKSYKCITYSDNNHINSSMITKFLNQTLFLSDIKENNNDNQCLNLFIYLYGSHLYSDLPDVNIRDKIIQYYNMLLDGSPKYMKTKSHLPSFIAIYDNYYNEIIAIHDPLNITLNQKMIILKDVMNNLINNPTINNVIIAIIAITNAADEAVDERITKPLKYILTILEATITVTKLINDNGWSQLLDQIILGKLANRLGKDDADAEADQAVATALTGMVGEKKKAKAEKKARDRAQTTTLGLRNAALLAAIPLAPASLTTALVSLNLAADVVQVVPPVPATLAALLVHLMTALLPARLQLIIAYDNAIKTQLPKWPKEMIETIELINLPTLVIIQENINKMFDEVKRALKARMTIILLIAKYNLPGIIDLLQKPTPDQTNPYTLKTNISSPTHADLMNINTLNSEIPIHQNVVEKLNDILPGHINTLNLWLALDNIKVNLHKNKIYNFIPSIINSNPPIYLSVPTFKLNNFLLVPNSKYNYNAESQYGIISDQRGNLIQDMNVNFRVANANTNILDSLHTHNLALIGVLNMNPINMLTYIQIFSQGLTAVNNLSHNAVIVKQKYIKYIMNVYAYIKAVTEFNIELHVLHGNVAILTAENVSILGSHVTNTNNINLINTALGNLADINAVNAANDALNLENIAINTYIKNNNEKSLIIENLIKNVDKTRKEANITYTEVKAFTDTIPPPSIATAGGGAARGVRTNAINDAITAYNRIHGIGSDAAARAAFDVKNGAGSADSSHTVQLLAAGGGGVGAPGIAYEKFLALGRTLNPIVPAVIHQNIANVYRDKKDLDNKNSLLELAKLSLPTEAIPGKGAIPIGYNKLATNKITTKWGGFNDQKTFAPTKAGFVQTNITNRKTNSAPYTGSTLDIINNLSKLGIFEGAIDHTFSKYEIKSTDIDTMIHEIFTKIQTSHNKTNTVPTVVGNINLFDNPTPYEIAENKYIIDINTINTNILNIIAGQDLTPAVNMSLPGNPQVLEILNEAKKTLIIAVIEGIIKDENLVMSPPRKMNNMNRAIFNHAGAYGANNGILNAVLLAGDLKQSIFNAFDLIGCKSLTDVIKEATITKVCNAIAVNDDITLANEGKYLISDQSIQSILNQPNVITQIQRDTAPNNLDNKIYEALNNGKVPELNTKERIDICKKVIRAVLTGYLTEVPKITSSTLTQIRIVPNSFDIGNSDYMNYIKKRFIMWFVQRLKTENFLIVPPIVAIIPDSPNKIISGNPLGATEDKSTNLTKIFTDIYTIMVNHFKNSEELTEPEYKLKTVSIIIKVLDRLFINTLKSEIYLLAINKLKTVILADKTKLTYKTYKNKVVKFLDQMLHNSNVSIKLDKKINQMILIQDQKHQINTNYDDNDIINEKNIKKLFDYDSITHDDPTQIYKTDKADYIVHYPQDYVSLQPISLRQCLYNTTSVVEMIYNNSPELDYNKLDTNKFTPIYYAIQSKNHLLIKKFINLINPAQQTTNTYQIQTQLNGYNRSPIFYAYEQIINSSKMPKFNELNVTFMNNLLLSGDIKRNIPKDYYDMYKYLIWDLHQFFLNPETHTFRGLIQIQQSQIKQHIMNTVINPYISTDILEIIEYKSPLDTTYTNTLITDLDQQIINIKSIESNMTLIIQHKIQNAEWFWGATNNQQAAINLQTHIENIKKVVVILESRYKSNKLYDYVNEVRSNTIKLNKTNEYLLMLISLGIISIRDILKEYYNKIILKTIYTTNIYNFDFVNENKLVLTQIEMLNNEYIQANIFDMVRVYYFIKLDQYDNLTQNQNIIEEYFTKLLELFTQNGIINSESKQYDNIKQYVHTHMIELVTKTLQYVQVIIDIFHRWTVNLYHSLKTYDEITKIK